MKIKKLLPVLLMALGLTLAAPLTTGATGTNGTTSTVKETAGFHKDSSSGYYYYIKSDGTRATGFNWINITSNGTTKKWLYYFDSNGLLNLPAGKVKIGDDYYFRYTGQESAPYMLATNVMLSYNGKYYLAGADGKLVCSAVKSVNGKLYGFGPTGERWKKGVRRLNGQVYYASSTGKLITNKWQRIKARYYYFDSNGRMTGLAKKTIGGKTYFYRVDTSSSSLAYYKNGWYTDPSTGNKYYARSNGRLVTGFKTIGGKKYYFNKKGVLIRSAWVRSNGYYRANSKGEIVTGFFKVGSKRYYANEKGKRVTGLRTINSKTYYFSRSGVQQSGFQKVKKKLYYFDPNLKSSSKNSARTGWFNVGKNSYYAGKDGSIVTGFVVYNSSRYYLDPDNNGAMIKNKTVTINGTSYSFDSEGRQKGWSLSNYPWIVKVNATCNVVTVYRGEYPIIAFLCSTGVNNATPRGTFSIKDKLYLHELNGPTWGYYCSHITDDILFHSLPQYSSARYDFPAAKYNLLGQQASQGCIRLRMGDAYWLYKNVPVGTTVIVYDSANPGPLGKPTYKQVPLSLTVDPTDPSNAVNRSYAPDYTYG